MLTLVSLLHLEWGLGMRLVLVCIFTPFGMGSGYEASLSLCLYSRIHLEWGLGMRLVLVCFYTPFRMGSGYEAGLCFYTPFGMGSGYEARHFLPLLVHNFWMLTNLNAPCTKILTQPTPVLVAHPETSTASEASQCKVRKGSPVVGHQIQQLHRKEQRTADNNRPQVQHPRKERK